MILNDFDEHIPPSTIRKAAEQTCGPNSSLMSYAMSLFLSEHQASSILGARVLSRRPAGLFYGIGSIWL